MKNIELEVGRPSKNHPLKLQHIKIKLETSQELIWDLTENQAF